MSYHFETSYEVNVKSLSKFIQFISGLKTDYNPPSNCLSAASLTMLYSDMKIILGVVNRAEEVWKRDSESRAIAFGQLDSFLNDLPSLLRSTYVPEQVIDSVTDILSDMSENRKVLKNQRRKNKLALSGTAIEQPITRSRNQESFDMKIDGLSEIILILEGVTNYPTMEPELQMVALQTRLASLILMDMRVGHSAALLKSACLERNRLFELPETGMLTLVKKSKAYLRIVFGKKSLECQMAEGIKFAWALPRFGSN